MHVRCNNRHGYAEVVEVSGAFAVGIWFTRDMPQLIISFLWMYELRDHYFQTVEFSMEEVPIFAFGGGGGSDRATFAGKLRGNIQPVSAHQSCMSLQHGYTGFPNNRKLLKTARCPYYTQVLPITAP